MYIFKELRLFNAVIHGMLYAIFVNILPCIVNNALLSISLTHFFCHAMLYLTKVIYYAKVNMWARKTPKKSTN
jgi:hypothetical protein